MENNERLADFKNLYTVTKGSLIHSLSRCKSIGNSQPLSVIERAVYCMSHPPSTGNAIRGEDQLAFDDESNATLCSAPLPLCSPSRQHWTLSRRECCSM